MKIKPMKIDERLSCTKKKKKMSQAELLSKIKTNLQNKCF